MPDFSDPWFRMPTLPLKLSEAICGYLLGKGSFGIQSWWAL
jgi:hypothetical protein